MKHLGDITKIDGRRIATPDCIIGGSPCQDLSVAGKRAGLAGERSGLFMEQIRITKELRDEDSRTRPALYVRPRFFVWENVDGARSSNNGEDFRAVLEEVVRIVEKDAVIPEPPKGKWASAGCIVGDRWSVAWRVFDAQFWGSTYFSADGVAVKLGTPQRRRRIALVADFGGQCAPEILLIRKGLHGRVDEIGEEGQRTSACFAKSSREPSSWDGTDTSPTLTSRNAGGGQRMPDKQNFNAVIDPVPQDIPSDEF